jgi:hypothetical protein
VRAWWYRNWPLLVWVLMATAALEIASGGTYNTLTVRGFSSFLLLCIACVFDRMSDERKHEHL